MSPEQYRNDLKALIAVTAPAALVTHPDFGPQAAEAIAGSDPAPQLISTSDVQPRVTEAEPSNDLHAADPEDTVLLQHSSGTTGLQKGVALSHRAVLAQVEVYGECLDLQSKDVIVSWLPLYHDMGLIAGFILPLASGVPLVLMSHFNWVVAPYRLLQAVSQYKGTLSWLPNFAYNFCAQKIRERDIAGIDLSSWRAVLARRS